MKKIFSFLIFVLFISQSALGERTIDLPENSTKEIMAYGVCHRLRNTDKHTYMIPIGSSNDWASFRYRIPKEIVFSPCLNPSTAMTPTSNDTPLCTAPWGGSISPGASVTVYQASSVAAPAQCVSETRTCNNGTLSGSFSYPSCTVNPVVANCSLGGVVIPDGGWINAYESSSVVAPNTCKLERRTCTNGVLSGSYTNQNCSSCSGGCSFSNFRPVGGQARGGSVKFNAENCTGNGIPSTYLDYRYLDYPGTTLTAIHSATFCTSGCKAVMGPASTDPVAMQLGASGSTVRGAPGSVSCE